MDKKTEPKYNLRLIFYSERARKILYGVYELKATREKTEQKKIVYSERAKQSRKKFSCVFQS